MRLLLRSFLLLSLPVLDAAAVSVRVVAPSELHLPETIRAKVRRVDGDPAPTKSVLLSSTASTNLDLGPGTWEIAADVADAWTEPVYASGSADVTLTVYPRGTIAGRMQGELTPAEQLILHFAPADGEGSGPSGKTLCTTAPQTWNCTVPAGEHDVRFTRSGYATEFRFGLRVRPGGTFKFGLLQFTPGSSVAGRVHIDSREGRELLKDVEVAAYPRGAATLGDKTRKYTSKPDARGFFQVRGLAPGDYELHAGAKGLVSDPRIVQIIAGTNAELKEPVVLGPPLRVSVKIDPPLDPTQKPWHVRLLKSYEGRADAVAASNASRDGAWSAESVVPGDYTLVAGQEDGADWKREQLELRTGDAELPVFLRLDSARVRGRVSLGDRAIAAKVHFPDENGVALVAGEDGRFEGTVPPQQSERFKLLVTSDVPAVSRSLVVEAERSPAGELTFDIKLPSSVFAGRTLGEDGSPAAHAIVSIQSEDGAIFEQLSSASDGAFQFAGFDPGVYFVEAELRRARSARKRVEVGPESLESIDLVLRREAVVIGRITMRGAPVFGATIAAFPRDAVTSFLPETTSATDGAFVLHVPPDATIFDFIAIPRGFYVTACRLPRDDKKNLVVEVGQDGGLLTVTVPKDDPGILRYDGAEFSPLWLAQASRSPIEEIENNYRITLPSLEPGNYALCRKGQCVPVVVPPFGKAAATLVD